MSIHIQRSVPVLALLVLAVSANICAADPGPPKRVGILGKAGCLDNPKKVERLEITQPGVYENFLVDGHWQGGNRVKITADHVTVRHCEIMNATGNGIGVFAPNVVIENCRIHHLLAGTFKEQADAHGITGRWGNVVIRNCEIFYTSGDSVQFDPDRKSTGSVLIEDCTFWTGPLPEDAAGFKKGERPGENALDTKIRPDGGPCSLTVRNCYFHGWKQPGQITSLAAFNLKENVIAKITRCLVTDSEIAFRLRGPGKQDGANVEMEDCAIYDCDVGVRMEDKIRDLKIHGLSFGPGVTRKYQMAGGGTGPGYVNEGERNAPPLD